MNKYIPPIDYLNIFPEAEGALLDNIAELESLIQLENNRYIDHLEDITNVVYKNINDFYIKTWTVSSLYPKTIVKYQKRLNKLKSVYRLHHPQPVSKNSVSDDDINYARNIELRPLMECMGFDFTARGKTNCFMHDDKTPSLTVKDNVYYCFPCGSGGDTIKAVMKINNCNFIDAVRFLCRK